MKVPLHVKNGGFTFCEGSVVENKKGVGHVNNKGKQSNPSGVGKGKLVHKGNREQSVEAGKRSRKGLADIIFFSSIFYE